MTVHDLPDELTREEKLEKLLQLLWLFEAPYHLQKARERGDLQISEQTWNRFRNLWISLETK